MKVQKKFLLQGAILLFLGLGLGFGLGSFYASAPVIGCRENDLTPIPDEGFVSPAASEVPAGTGNAAHTTGQMGLSDLRRRPQQDDAGRSGRAERRRSPGHLFCGGDRVQREVSAASR